MKSKSVPFLFKYPQLWAAAATSNLSLLCIHCYVKKAFHFLCQLKFNNFSSIQHHLPLLLLLISCTHLLPLELRIMRKGNVNFFLLLNEVEWSTKRELKLIYRLKELHSRSFSHLKFSWKKSIYFSSNPKKTFSAVWKFTQDMIFNPSRWNGKLFNLLFINMNRVA